MIYFFTYGCTSASASFVGKSIGIMSKIGFSGKQKLRGKFLCIK